MKTIFCEIHCQKCGEFRASVEPRRETCPVCGDPQVIILPYLPPVPRYLERFEDYT